MDLTRTDVIAAFDIGRSWMKFHLFDKSLHPLLSEEKLSAEPAGTTGRSSDDFKAVEQWMQSCLSRVVSSELYSVRRLTLAAGDDSLAELEQIVLKTAGSVIPGSTVFNGTGMSSEVASLVPYLKGSDRPFILVSTGTRCTFMNPFDTDQAAGGQAVKGIKVRSSQFNLGEIHDRNVMLLDEHFGVTGELYKTIKIKHKKVGKIEANRHGRVFFRHGIPGNLADSTANLSHFLTYADAYHQMMYDLVDESLGAYRKIITPDDITEIVYVTGGFARNDTFTRILAARLPEKRVYASTIEYATALGAAMTAYGEAFDTDLPPVYLGLKAILLRDE